MRNILRIVLYFVCILAYLAIAIIVGLCLDSVISKALS